MVWKKGPLPPDTYQFGGVALHQPNKNPTGFYFATFYGDHALILIDGRWKHVRSYEVAYYNNSLTLPIPTDDMKSAIHHIRGET